MAHHRWEPDIGFHARMPSFENARIHYHLLGSSTGPLVVMVHGIGSYSYWWTPLSDALIDNGYRVLVFDWFGRGRSDGPDVVHDGDHYVQVLAELLDVLGLEGEFNLIGHSMGGACAVLFAAAHPERVRKLILLAPAGTGDKPFIAKCISCCCCGGTMMKTQSADDVIANDYFDGHHPSVEGDVEKHEWQLENDGDAWRHAFLSAVRNFPLWGLEETIESLGAETMPVFIMWGEEDVVVPFSGLETYATLLPNATTFAIPECGHALIREKPEVALRIINNWLRSTRRVSHLPRPPTDGRGSSGHGQSGSTIHDMNLESLSSRKQSTTSSSGSLPAASSTFNSFTATDDGA